MAHTWQNVEMFKGSLCCSTFLLWLITVIAFSSLAHSTTTTNIDNSQRPFSYYPLQLEKKTTSFALDDLGKTWKPPLSTRGRYVVDANGKRFKLKAGSWHGASGTYLGRGDKYDRTNHWAGEATFQTPLCLDRTHIKDIVQSFLDLGLTTIRLPFSNEMIHSKELPPTQALRANPQFIGLTPLQIYDACIVELTKRGLAIVLNNHTVKTLWCCGLDANARWNYAQSDDEWLDDWLFMVRRYKTNARVIGADLYNEVRRDYFRDPVWGEGGITDWWAASQLAGTRIQREANSDLLIIIEGINYVGIPTPYTRHYRPELQPIRYLSHTFPILDKLVYCAHFYAYTGPNATGGPDIGRTRDVLYRDLNPPLLEETVNELAFYVATTPNEHFTNPVWISEVGSAGRGDYLIKNRWWWSNFTNLLIKYDIDYALWPLTGWQENGNGNLWAFNAWDSRGKRLSIFDPGDWRLPAFINLLQSDGKTGKVDLIPQWRMLYTGLGSMQLSNSLYKESTLEQSGSIKASCPDGLRLVGLGQQGNHLNGLCTDNYYGRKLWKETGRSFEIVSSSIYVTSDWAQGQIKYQCASNHHIIGYSASDLMVKDIVCAKSSSQNLVTKRSSEIYHTVWLLHPKDRVNSSTQQAWHQSHTRTAACSDDQILVGVALTSLENVRQVIALLCQREE